MNVFVSHGARDTWIAKQIARNLADVGASTFLDAYDLVTGDAFEREIRDGLARCDELLALFTPLSLKRAWVFMEIGAAWMQNKRISALLYGLGPRDFEGDNATGAGLLNTRHMRDLNEFDAYLDELKGRLDHGR